MYVTRNKCLHAATATRTSDKIVGTFEFGRKTIASRSVRASRSVNAECACNTHKSVRCRYGQGASRWWTPFLHKKTVSVSIVFENRECSHRRLHLCEAHVWPNNIYCWAVNRISIGTRIVVPINLSWCISNSDSDISIEGFSYRQAFAWRDHSLARKHTNAFDFICSSLMWGDGIHTPKPIPFKWENVNGFYFVAHVNTHAQFMLLRRRRWQKRRQLEVGRHDRTKTFEANEQK